MTPPCTTCGGPHAPCPNWLTVAEAAVLLGVTQSHVRRLAAGGLLASARHRGRRLIDRASAMAYAVAPAAEAVRS